MHFYLYEKNILNLQKTQKPKESIGDNLQHLREEEGFHDSFSRKKFFLKNRVAISFLEKIFEFSLKFLELNSFALMSKIRWKIDGNHFRRNTGYFHISKNYFFILSHLTESKKNLKTK